MTKYQTPLILTSSILQNNSQIVKKMIFHYKSNWFNLFRLMTFFLTVSIFLFPLKVSGQYICETGDCVNGIGKKKVKNSQAYMEGKFVEGVLTEGKVFFRNGDIFQGKFEDSKLVEGQKTFKGGNKLEGKFVEGVLIKGKITYMDGTSSLIELNKLN